MGEIGGRVQNVLRNSGASVALSSLALAVAAPGVEAKVDGIDPSRVEEAPAASSLTPATIQKAGNIAATASGVSMSYNAMMANRPASQNTNFRIQQAQPPKFWYGKPGQLRYIKEHGNTQNAVLTYTMAMQQPWASIKQIRCLDLLWFAESKFEERARNPSGAAGIAQLKSENSREGEIKGWERNPIPQIEDGFTYIEMTKKEGGQGYLVPCSAYTHFLLFNWY